ncbi:hypothetical protein QZH41_001437 [Actinostola sp. cb2023]|nr:hypothetical protein QZH41_001437 [Actinostola sp. cb2023]
MDALPSSIVVYGGENSRSGYVFNAELKGRTVEVELDRLELPEDTEFPISMDTTAPLAEGTVSRHERLVVDLSHGELIENTLKHYFGFSSFRPLQKETINASLCGKDVLTVVGTGGGKTLMFLLPAVLASKPTLVISPLKSLIEDQVARCCTLNISCCKFTGDVCEEISATQIREIMDYRVLFVTPEMLEYGLPLREKIDQLLSEDKIERIVFDKAHTISTWGNTFRPVYKTVCEGLAEADCPTMLLSATIPMKLENDLKLIFGNFITYRTSIYRENLYLEVQERSTKMLDEIAEFVKSHENDSGIIYCVLPHDVSTIHSELVKRDICSVKYHGKLSEELKAASFANWMSGEVKVMVANSSFGMGIDKANVKFMFHARLPTNIEEYLQQCGRAGRDGAPATCRLYFSSADKNPLYKLFHSQGNTNFVTESSNLNDLILMLQDPVQCRHKALMTYFGEKVDNFLCIEKCDNCKDRDHFK